MTLQIVGEYFADIVVSDKVIVEIKAVQTLTPAHEVQLVNYLKATNIDVGLLLNFGESLAVKRRIPQKLLAISLRNLRQKAVLRKTP